MRIIERKIVNAMLKLESGVFGNTAITVVSDPRGNTPHKVEMTLHGSLIATFNVHADKSIRALCVTLAGWNTRITRARLTLAIQHAAKANGLIPEQYPRGLGVSSRAGIVRIHDKRGETVIDPHGGWHVVEI